MFITEDPIACKMQKKMFALPENTNKALTLSEITNQMAQARCTQYNVM
jgi:hypothetical protein